MPAALGALDGTATRLLACGVVAMLTVLAFLPNSGDEDKDIAADQLVELLLSKAWNQMEPHDALVSVVSLGLPFLADDMRQPVGQAVGHRPALGRGRDAMIRLAEQLGQLLPRVLIRARVGRLALQPSGGCQHVCLDLVAVVFARRDSTLAGSVALGHRQTFPEHGCADWLAGQMAVASWSKA